ncbi:MAG TPA: DUF6527 family protein [Lacunisphaera sp.]
MKKFTVEFVEHMPQPLETGVLYVSIRFRLVAHNCPCGCGNEVVTNLSPTGWRLTFNGHTISLHPSIGNWDFPCRSHYWIRQNTVQWAESWTDRKIAQAKREQDHANSDLGLKEPVRRRPFWQRLLGSE